jgi:hypothetical protein
VFVRWGDAYPLPTNTTCQLARSVAGITTQGEKKGEEKKMVILSLLILNKAGGLIFQRDFNEGLKKLSSNDYLVLAGTFHGVHAITSRISPVRNSGGGLEVLESDRFRMQCFQTLTGTKFLIFAEPNQPNIDVVVKRVYELYADYVMKNPFYQIEMPIRCEAFERNLVAYIKPK